MNAANDEYYFRYSATLRIFGDIPDLAELTRRSGTRSANGSNFSFNSKKS
jgi:hypothetical protein